MNVVEAHSVLGLAQDASLEDVKRSYRQLAFRYHPDLHPEDPHAKRKFQRINEAYLLLRQILAEGPPRAAKGKEKPRPEEPGPQPGAWRKAKTAYTKASNGKPEKTNYYFRREDVLQDILKDAFARQVFEDIYSELRKEGRGSQPVQGSRTSRQLDVRVGASRWSLDLSGGIVNGIKGLLMRQLDDEQTVTVPPASLLPGAKLRVGVAQGLGSEPKTVEFTLPRDYSVGQPIRLKGLGRRLGPWKGDLYLRLTLG